MCLCPNIPMSRLGQEEEVVLVAVQVNFHNEQSNHHSFALSKLRIHRRTCTSLLRTTLCQKYFRESEIQPSLGAAGGDLRSKSQYSCHSPHRQHNLLLAMGLSTFPAQPLARAQPHRKGSRFEHGCFGVGLGIHALWGWLELPQDHWQMRILAPTGCCWHIWASRSTSNNPSPVAPLSAT